MFRNEKPGPGRFRQFMQFDADTVGAPVVAADAEMCMMMADTMEALGIKRGDYVIKVNNRKVLDGVLEAIGLGGDENAGRRLTVLRAIDKLDKLGPEGVRAPARRRAARTRAATSPRAPGWTTAQIDAVLAFTTARGAMRGRNAAATRARSVGELRPRGSRRRRTNSRRSQRWSTAAGYGDDRIVIDPSVVRGLEYYTGPVFEAELTFEVTNEDGQTVRFGSVGGGGRYDGLVSRFRGEPVPATGFSIGVSRLHGGAEERSASSSARRGVGPVVVLVMDRDRASADYQKMVSELRAAGIRAEMYLGGSGMKAQMKYADRRGAPCVGHPGRDEREAKGEVQIKDLVLGAEIAGASSDRAAYLKEQHEAQFAAPEAEMVAAVRKVLARQRLSSDAEGRAQRPAPFFRNERSD